MIQSQAWKSSLEEGVAAAPQENKDFYYSSLDVGIKNSIPAETMETEDVFEKKYHSLVSRAYYKIISEAEAADQRLRSEYARLSAKKGDVSAAQSAMYAENLAIIDKRYRAHTEMLEGLKSWNIFSEYRSGDLIYFKEDNIDAVSQMHAKGRSDESIINFLVFKLADLYHFE